MKYAPKTTGYSLVEVLIAITILLLAIAGPLTIATKGLQTSYFARDQLTAFMLAQEGIELIIALRNEAVISEINGTPPFDLGRNNLWSWSGVTGTNHIDSCFTANGCNVSSYDESIIDNFRPCGANGANCELNFHAARNRGKYHVGTGGFETQFTRVINLTQRGSDREIDVVSTVTWQPTVFSGGVPKTIELKTSILNLYANP